MIPVKIFCLVFIYVDELLVLFGIAGVIILLALDQMSALADVVSCNQAYLPYNIVSKRQWSQSILDIKQINNY